MNLREDYALSLKIIRLIFFLVIYLHLIACLWYFLVRIDNEWMPPLDYVWVKTDFYELSIPMKYYLSLYHSVLMLTGNDIGPRGAYQVLFVAIAISMGAIINAQLFGELALIVSAMNMKNTRFQEKLDVANAAMKNIKLPEKT